MPKFNLPVFLAVAAVMLAEPAALRAEAAPAPQVPASAPVKKSGHVAANGIRYAYEIRGEGEPLLLLHGGLGTMDMFAPIMPALTEAREVIAVDLHGHGRTELGDRPISLPAIGDDLALILESSATSRSTCSAIPSAPAPPSGSPCSIPSWSAASSSSPAALRRTPSSPK